MINWHDTEAFAQALEQANVSVDDFAIISGVSRAQLFRLKAGAKPTWETDHKIRSALDSLGQSATGPNDAPDSPAPQSPRRTITKDVGNAAS